MFYLKALEAQCIMVCIALIFASYFTWLQAYLRDPNRDMKIAYTDTLSSMELRTDFDTTGNVFLGARYGLMPAVEYMWTNVIILNLGF